MPEKEKLRWCPLCRNIAPLRLTKLNTDYFQCVACRTLFSDPLDNEDKIGGVAEVERNQKENHERIDRVKRALRGVVEGPRILDFGCGHGLLVKDLQEVGYKADGYDCFNPEFNQLPKHNLYEVVTAIEVVEHTSQPYHEFDVIMRALKPGGMVIIETSFVDVAEKEGIALEDFPYVSPEAGHSTIFSHHGLDVLMCLKGFLPSAHWNRHVRSYMKPFN